MDNFLCNNFNVSNMLPNSHYMARFHKIMGLHGLPEKSDCVEFKKETMQRYSAYLLTYFCR